MTCPPLALLTIPSPVLLVSTASFPLLPFQTGSSWGIFLKISPLSPCLFSLLTLHTWNFLQKSSLAPLLLWCNKTYLFSPLPSLSTRSSYPPWTLLGDAILLYASERMAGNLFLWCTTVAVCWPGDSIPWLKCWNVQTHPFDLCRGKKWKNFWLIPK